LSTSIVAAGGEQFWDK